MIIDIITNADRYISFHPRFAKAFEWLKAQDIDSIEVGKYPIDGKDIHASVSQKPGVTREEAKFEAHNDYIDIQFCPTGKEELGWRPRDTCVDPKDAYNPEKDVVFYNDVPDTYFQLRQNQFAIFFPEDVHAPMIGDGDIKKLVIKIKL